MTAGEVYKKSSRNSRINLSHTLGATKPNQLKFKQLQTNIQQQRPIYYNRGASNIVKFKKSKNNPAATRESTNSHPRKLKDQNNKPAY